MYALLFTDISDQPESQRLTELGQLLIVRLCNGKQSIASNCFFTTEGTEHDTAFPRVDPAVYSSGKSKTQQEDARRFLEKIGVREVGETEQVQALLKQRYASASGIRDDSTYDDDLKRFVALVNKSPDQASFFKVYFIFQAADKRWITPSDAYFDAPIKETGLGAYFCHGKDVPSKSALADRYLKSPVPIDDFVKFAGAIGVQMRLEITVAHYRDNPAVKGPLEPISIAFGVDRDHTIRGIAGLLKRPNEALSRLVWKTACEWRGTWLQAEYRKNSRSTPLGSPSQLVCILRDTAWMPQTDGRFVLPREASLALLPKGFLYDSGAEWLKAVHFGEAGQNQLQETPQDEITAKKLGFPDADSLDRARRFAALPPEEQQRFLSEHEQPSSVSYPEKEPRDPEHRARTVADQVETAPQRIVEERPRKVPVNQDKVKQDAQAYLRHQYTNPDGDMFCQICWTKLPFRLDDGLYYFETVEFLRLRETKRYYYQNYLALCPNHSAMFRHANGSSETMKASFTSVDGLQLAIVLAQSPALIRFTSVHIADLKAVIGADQKGALREFPGDYSLARVREGSGSRRSF